ncbi:hypothetical protein [Caulobacter hibisci]|uniref:Uncharacterized protein n=1 Tax=Caulobacter hibisci TaxID=2035993 RepID=A0ABS0SSE8_9CAUL|nr:hypothetical protein [Caulobacter hibisci]MBI1682519.1 hypothetical protein [Caulobacter hibisci]
MLVLVAAMFLQASSPPPPPSPPESHCFVREQTNGHVFVRYLGDRACVDFAPARTISGVWIDQFEGSSFYEGATSLSDIAGRKHTTWLTLDAQTELPAGFVRKRPTARAYRLTFVGRNARDMDRLPLEGYGHFGVSPGLVLVDRLTVWEDLGPAPGR